MLDAIPSKRFIKKDNNFFEKVIKIKNDKLFYSLIDCEISHKKEIENIESRLNIELPNNYNFEINFLYEDFFSDIFINVENYVFLLIDYGYSEREFYHPERSSGTIQYYKNHKKIS